MWTEGSRVWRRSVFYLPTKSNTWEPFPYKRKPRMSFHQASTESTDSRMDSTVDSVWESGKWLQILLNTSRSCCNSAKILCIVAFSPDLTTADYDHQATYWCSILWSALWSALVWSSKDVKVCWMNHRGISYTFGSQKVVEFLIKNDMALICNAQQVSLLHNVHVSFSLNKLHNL